MERMVEAVPDSDYQSVAELSHTLFVGTSRHHGSSGEQRQCVIGAEVGVGLYIDESAFEKKGEKSVGLFARQWNGRLGKQDNCQVGVFGALWPRGSGGA